MQLKNSLILVLLSPLILGNNSCQTNKQPEWEAKFWAANAELQAIVRAQDNLRIQCNDPVFSDYICISYSDLLLLQTDVLNKCKKWEARPSYSEPQR